MFDQVALNRLSAPADLQIYGLVARSVQRMCKSGTAENSRFGTLKVPCVYSDAELGTMSYCERSIFSGQWGAKDPSLLMCYGRSDRRHLLSFQVCPEPDSNRHSLAAEGF